MKIARNILLIVVLLVNTISVFAKGPEFEIVSVNYYSSGRTLPTFIERAAEIEIGKKFSSKEELSAYVKDRQQFLLNNRVFASVLIKIETGKVKDGIVPVYLKVSTKDTWNIIAFPYFKYDSNTGLLLSFRARNYDFFGTMEPLRINLNWEMDENSDIFWGMDADFTYPFDLWGLEWTWGLNTLLDISETGTYFSLDNNLTLSIPLSIGTLSFTAGQGVYSEGSGTSYAAVGDGLYFSESLGTSLEIPVYTFPNDMDITWSPSVTFQTFWDYNGIATDSLKGPDIILGQDLGFGRVDWEGNFRKGYIVSLNNTNTWNMYEESWDRSISFSTAGYTNWKWGGVSSRLSGFYSFDLPDTSAGDPIRGVLNDRISADSALFFNLDFPVRVIQFTPSKWFGKKWMRVFDFEQHWSPFFDCAYSYLNTDSGSKTWYAGGLEIITYPLIMRSFYLRISMGWDLRDVIELKSLSGNSLQDGEGIRELFIGFGHLY